LAFEIAAAERKRPILWERTKKVWGRNGPRLHDTVKSLPPPEGKGVDAKA